MIILIAGPSKLREETIFVQENKFISHFGTEEETLKIELSK